MLLGKKYTRIKRRCNAAQISVSFRDKCGNEIRLPRKLNMLGVLSLSEKVSKDAVEKEILKFKKRLEQQPPKGNKTEEV